LDALVDGLYAAGHISRLRQAVPEYRYVEDASREVEETLSHLREQLEASENDITSLKARLRGELIDLSPDLGSLLEDAAGLQRILTSENEGEELQRVARNRRDVAALQAQWDPIAAAPGAVERKAAEAEDQEARSLLEGWWNTSGRALEELIDQLREMFPDLPSARATDPEYARAALAVSAGSELVRCMEERVRHDADSKRTAELDQTLARGEARIALIDEQINVLAGETEGLSHALTMLLPHIHSEECPVCGRDYSEMSSETLISHVSARITTLAERAGRLQALSKEKADATGLLGAARRERGVLASRQLSRAAQDDLKTRQAALADAVQKLDGLTTAAAEGVGLIERASRSGRRLADLRSRDQRLVILTDAVNSIADQRGQPRIGPAESTGSALSRLDEHLSSREAILIRRQRAREASLLALSALTSATESKRVKTETLRKNQERFEGLRSAQTKADARIQQARQLARAARETRTAIVRRVFNESLNATWERLFVRLAPDEPFVPAFALPEGGSGPVEAVLQTVHRSGGHGGNPQAVLSAGNLNTAALTLFLAVHLSVEPALPWLVIDDPVQSMDEVHVSQFAALLRTLSKQQHRQIVLAVHERPLFEYLALELSPAFQDDRLITIELGRAADGSSTMVYEPKTWTPDVAIAA
jgi:exonuclease SbcC